MAMCPALAFGASRMVSARTPSANPDSVPSASIRRSATSVIARNAATNGRGARTTVTARPATVSRVASNRVVSDRATVDGATVSRSAANKNTTLSRSATKSNSSARSASMSKGANISRAAQNRATAVFNDVSKIGGGYANCRDSYATCMDQICANANDEYRRCYCNDRFINYRKTADSLDTALTMLAEFQNTNLDAVNKTAAEINAMYTASEGESAIKRDTSASQKLLDKISDVLSGKSSYQSSTTNTNSNVLNVSGLFGSSNLGDVFSGGGTAFDTDVSSLFGGGYTNMSDMEGNELYNAANNQCAAVVRGDCGGDASFNLARSAYSMMITNDCNLYEKNINAKKESVMETVRTAEKYLREARLDEYRAHNSADVNACMDRVETAMRQPTACGADYEKCLDYTGMYINNATGEPVYSPALFGLNNLIKLDGSADVVSANPDFNEFLESRKMFVTTALDTCRNIADTVWNEFKRSAIIKISQAQDEKIEEVKNSCIETIAECYDQQTGALESTGDDYINGQMAGMAAITAHNACSEKVLACAALYGDPDGCIYDDTTKKITQKSGKTCGLQSLLAYVNVADSLKVARGCENALRTYAKNNLCIDDDAEYPWGCRRWAPNDLKSRLVEYGKTVCGADFIVDVPKDTPDIKIKRNEVGATVAATELNDKAAIHKNVIARAGTTVEEGEELDTNLVSSLTQPEKIVDSIIREIKNDLEKMLSAECNGKTGDGRVLWVSSDSGVSSSDVVSVSPTWMKNVYGTDSDLSVLTQSGLRGHIVKLESSGVELRENSNKSSFGWGLCMKPTDRQACQMQQNLPKMTENDIKWTGSKCDIKTTWYQKRCESIGGYYQGQRCYVR